MDQPNNVVLDAIDFVPETLANAVVYDAGGQKIGTVSHVHGLGPTSQVVVDVGGFLGIGSKPVTLPARNLIVMRDADGSVHAQSRWTKEQVRGMLKHFY